jgi:hopanoid biosynthesis associated RND transporter like protein HpnN
LLETCLSRIQPAIGAQSSLVERWVAACCRRARLVVVITLALAAGALAYAATHFAMTSDTDNLLSTHLPYRVREAAFSALFQPEGDQIVVVIDGRTPELATAAAASLAQRLAARPDLFRTVQQPEGGFFAREGLLYQPLPQVRDQMSQLIAAQAFLGPLAEDPSLRGLMSTLSTTLKGVSAGQARLADLNRPITALNSALNDQRAGRPGYFSWSALISGKPADPATLRRIVLATPVLDFSALESGAKPSDFVRQSARALGLDSAHGVSVRLTGPIPLQDEQFGSIAHGVGWIATMALAAILLMLWMAVRSPRLIAAILVTMLIGLIAAMAGGLLIFGRFNVISVAFIPLFVGLGIDFGIQFTVRFRAEHARSANVSDALAAAAGGMGRSLILAATAIAVGFLAFAPTEYLGVSQLGVIAGAGMFMAVALNLTFLPPLILLLKPPAPGASAADSGALVERLDGYILGHRRVVLGSAIGAAAVSAALLPLLHFDFNPFHLENTRAEAVSTLLDLMRDPNQSPNTLEAVEPSLAAADALAVRLGKLPQVADTRTLTSFIPIDQAPKLAAIADASELLGITLDPLVVSPPPSDADVVASLRQTSADLRAASQGVVGPTASSARRLADNLDWLAAAPPAARAQAAQTLTSGLNVVLDQTRQALSAQPVTLQSLPPELTRDWLAKDGRARVSITARGDSNDNAVLDRFITAVSAVVPDATGTPVGIQKGGRTIAGAFIEAGVLSFVAITLLLFVVLRRVRDVAITMAPIVLTGLLTLGSCVIIGQPLNYANIIALPLLFGIGVAFHIYFVMAWRAGAAHLLQSSLTRAIFFSAMATATGFGSLWVSSHPGTASMGKLLMIALLWTLVSALLFQPALMGPPPASRAK